MKTLLRRSRHLSVAASLTLVLLLSGCRTELLAGLSQRQANETIALLQRHGIESQKKDMGKGRFRVDVSKSDFPEAVSLLERNQLPSRDNLSIADLFPTDSLVNSPAAERARLISGLEQRLEQTIRSIERILSARVHISYPLTERTEANREVHVSVMVNYDGPLNDAILIQRLKQLVKNSFDSLSYDNISIVIFQASAMPEAFVTPLARSGWDMWRWAPIAFMLLTAALAVAGLFWHRRKAQLKSNKP